MLFAEATYASGQVKLDLRNVLTFGVVSATNQGTIVMLNNQIKSQIQKNQTSHKSFSKFKSWKLFPPLLQKFSSVFFI